jgi:hypothetical protein
LILILYHKNMKTKIFEIAMVALLLLAGCSKDEFINKPSENNQLKKGSTKGMGITFIGTSSTDEVFIPICSPGIENCGRKLHANGNFSGNLTGYGKINPELSKYTFSVIEIIKNPYYGNPLYPREEEWSYKLEAKGRVSLSTSDYFSITITGYLITYEPLKDGRWIYGCVFTGNGKTDTDQGSKGGKFLNFNGEFYVKWNILNGTNFKGINLETGEISLNLELTN